MDKAQLQRTQAPLKEQYRSEPQAAQLTLSAESRAGEGVTCRLDTARGELTAGLHPATGGDGMALCSGDMLLEALAACAGVTLKAVATAMEIPLDDAVVRAEGDLDFRGTLGVDKQAPVGFKAIRLQFRIDSPASDEQLDTLIGLTERYCVVLQTLSQPPAVNIDRTRSAVAAQ